VSDPLERLRTLPRRPLAHLPTPLLPAPNLRAALGPDAPEILLKMDAETGMGLGGNKVRKLEMVLAPERLEGVTTLVTAGGPQSNHCRVTAAAAARLGLRCILVIGGEAGHPPRGNALLHRLFGAEIRTVARREDRAGAMEEVAREEAEAGRRARVIPVGASDGLGSLGYARAAVELTEQLAALPPLPDPARTWIFVCASSCGTVAGLLLGLAILGRTDVRLVAVSADVSAFDLRVEALRLAREGAEILGFPGPVPEGALAAADEFVGRGYGVPTPAGDEATELFGRTEGVVLDPVYTAKAASGMLAWIRKGSVPRDHRVVFVHTGGHPALLA
jgi:1-aminocyclopropane-1-carboxylate deaminase/D-cysteine desulfhydrase-like pyridoxal-dependent ACC family enzyme